MTEIISIMGKKTYGNRLIIFWDENFLITKIKSLKFQINPSWQNLKNKTFFFRKIGQYFGAFYKCEVTVNFSSGFCD